MYQGKHLHYSSVLWLLGLVINLWCGTLLSTSENLNLLSSTELSLPVVSVISSKNSSRLVKHNLSSLNPCWLSLIKLCGFTWLWTFHMSVPVFSPSKLYTHCFPSWPFKGIQWSSLWCFSILRNLSWVVWTLKMSVKN